MRKSAWVCLRLASRLYRTQRVFSLWSYVRRAVLAYRLPLPSESGASYALHRDEEHGDARHGRYKRRTDRSSLGSSDGLVSAMGWHDLSPGFCTGLQRGGSRVGSKNVIEHT